MQSPFEPEASYRYKAGTGYHGYAGFIVDMFNTDGDGVIIDRRLEQNTHSDQAFMREFQENHDSILDLADNEKAFVSTDAGFFSVELNERSSQLHWDMYCAGVHGTAPSPIFTEFKFNSDRSAVIQCPMGYTHFKLSRPSNGTFRLRFPDKCCQDCISMEECGAVISGKTEGKGSSYVTVSEAKCAAALCVKMREGTAGPNVVEYLNKRNAIEGINSVLRRRYNIDNRQIGGIQFACYLFYGLITCCNIIKYFSYYRKKKKKEASCV